MTPHPHSDQEVRPLPPLWARIVKYGIAVVTAIFYVTVMLGFEYTPDASYVSFRVASHVAQGEGFVSNPGEPSAGTSGPIWSLILGAGIWGGLDAPLVAKTFDLVFACLALFAVFFLAYLILRDKVAAFFAALLFSVDPWLLRSSASGLGYSLALLLATAVLWYGFKREYRIASFVCGFLILTAPLEGVVLFAMMMLDAIAHWRREKQMPGPFVESTGLALVCVLPWVAYSFFTSGPYFAGPSAGTFTGTPFFGPSGEPVLEALLWCAASGGVMILLLVVGHAVAVRRSDWRLLAPSSFPLLWALAALGVSFIANPAALTRTWVLVLPVIVIYGLMGLYYLSMFVIGLGRRSTTALLLAIVASLIANQGVYRVKVLPEMNRTVFEMHEQVRPMAHWLRSKIDPQEILLAPFGGLIGWVSDAQVRTSASLWASERSNAQDTSAGGLEILRTLLNSDHPPAWVVDRSSSGTRLAGLNLEPVRTLDGGGIWTDVTYTAYAGQAVRDSVLRSAISIGSEHNGK